MTVNLYDMADTWNNGATVFNGIKLNVTDTASDADSLLMDLQVGGVSAARINKSGHLFASQIRFTNVPVQGTKGQIEHNGGVGNGGQISFWPVTASSVPMLSCTNYKTTVPTLGLTDGSSAGTIYAYLYAVAGVHGTLEQRFGTTAQTFNIYNTWTNASNYERGFIRWASLQLQVGAESAGTGGNRTSRFGQQDYHLVAATARVEVRCGASANHVLFFDGTNQYFGAGQWAGQFDLGRAAYPWRNIYLRPSASLTPSNNGDLCIEATSNTALTFKLKGSDGTVRSGVLTLA